MPSSAASGDRVRVAIVSANAETLDDLQGYLRGVGVAASCDRHLGVVRELAPSVRVVIVFPDDFIRHEVIATFTAIEESLTRVLPVLVTSEPQRYGDLLGAGRIQVLPRPIWAWTIVDVIRARLTADVDRTAAPGHRKPRHRSR